LKEPATHTSFADTIETNEENNRTIFSGIPDIPSSEFEITSSGMGKVILGSDINQLEQLYDSVQRISVLVNGVQWPALKIIFPDSKWLIAESVNTIDIITHIRTNSPRFKTSEGHNVGIPGDSIIQSGGIISPEPQLGAFQISEKNIWFKVDEKETKRFFNNKNSNINLIKNSILKEIFIICGDC
jgi:hypothetical protein